jgi:hypothetical protein
MRTVPEFFTIRALIPSSFGSNIQDSRTNGDSPAIANCGFTKRGISLRLAPGIVLTRSESERFDEEFRGKGIYPVFILLSHCIRL